MENWMYGLIAIPVVAVGAAYGMGAFTKGPSVDESSLPALTSTSWKSPSALENALEEEKAAKADQARVTAGRRKKTKKSKSKNKKTNRRKH
jgi:hypothetical protein